MRLVLLALGAGLLASRGFREYVASVLITTGAYLLDPSPSPELTGEQARRIWGSISAEAVRRN